MPGLREFSGRTKALIYLLACWTRNANYGYCSPSGSRRERINGRVFVICMVKTTLRFSQGELDMVVGFMAQCSDP